MREMISVVLLKYKRPLDEIISHLSFALPVGEFVIWDDAKTDNTRLLGRWLGVTQCRYPVVYTQDDDCLILNAREIYKRFDGHHLRNGLKESHIGNITNGYWKFGETLVGWGAVFKQEWVISALQKYLANFPMDDVLYDGADLILTSLMPQPHHTIISHVQDFPSATDPEIAMYLQPGFQEKMAKARERARELNSIFCKNS